MDDSGGKNRRKKRPTEEELEKRKDEPNDEEESIKSEVKADEDQNTNQPPTHHHHRRLKSITHHHRNHIHQQHHRDRRAEHRRRQHRQSTHMARKSKEYTNGSKRILRIEHDKLLANLSKFSANHQANQQQQQQQQQQQVDKVDESLPNNQNLSYRQQQQMHQQQLQRTGGLQRLTADLAGLQFNDPELIFGNIQTTGAARDANQTALRLPDRSKATNVARSPQEATKSIKTANRLAAIAQAQSNQAAQLAEQGLEITRQTDIAIIGGGYEEQMTVSDGSQGSDFDPVKDAQETADDAGILNRFKIISLVGTGNYARVYKALSSKGKELAIKSINLSKTSENYKQKFLPRELNILKKISHINICKIHEIMQIADRVFIIMQFCSYGTIADLLHRIGPLSEPVVRGLFVQISDAVNYLHSIDLAHRDLKVENILLDSDYCPKLTDFSYSVSTSERTITNITTQKSAARLGTTRQSRQQRTEKASGKGSAKLNETFCGTLPYLSPEMIRQFPYDPKKTDIWSLGVCLYVMLNDRLPFPFNDIKLMLKKQLTKDYKFKANIEFSEQVKEIVSQMLEPDFSKRITTSEVTKHPWLDGPREKPSN